MPPKPTGSAAPAKKASAAIGTVGKRKKLSFDESALKAASAAVQTTHVGAEKPQAAAPSSAKAPAAVQKNKTNVADIKGSGIVKAQQTKKQAAAAAAEAEAKKVAVVHSDDSSEDDEADLLNGAGHDDDNLSDVADMPSSEDDEEAVKAPAKKAGERVIEPYRAVRLSFLPAEFQEPQLYKFLNQFGATVLNCFCVRSKRTHRSRGVAYVEFDKESVIPLVVEECNGMALGNMSVRAHAVTMQRPMPSRKQVTRRRALAYAHRTKGVPLKKHNVSKKSPIALLIKAARTEKANNAHLRKLGVDFQSDFFSSQLKAVPASVLRRPAANAPSQPAAHAKNAKKAPVAPVKKAAAAPAAKPAPKQVAKEAAATPVAKEAPKEAAKPAPKEAAKPAPKEAAKPAAPKVSSPKAAAEESAKPAAPKASPKKTAPKAAPKAAAKKAPRPAAKKAAPKKK